MQDKYYIDYRRGEIIKNLDTSWMAPELYNEVEINESLSGTYIYTYIDDNDRLLDFSFTIEMIQGKIFWDVLDVYCKKNNFVIAEIVRKIMYITQEEFNEAYKGA